MKASDGVLLFGTESSTRRSLWRSAMMSRSLTTHGVIDGSLQATETRSPTQTRRNLYSVEAMMPISWRGTMVVPSNVAQQIADRINACSEFRIGKGRSVRGRGRMVAQVINDGKEMEAYFQPLDTNLDRTAIVLQSPVAIPSHLHTELARGRMSAETVLRSIAADWLAYHQLPPLDSAPSTWASAGIRFGWNRHSSSGPLQGALPVLLPGSIFTLTEIAPKKALMQAICSGFHHNPHLADETLRRGFGCVAVHPGQAQAMFEGRGTLRHRNSAQLAIAMKVVYEMRNVSHLPRPSQIRAVEQRIRLPTSSDRPGSTIEALQYLSDQCQRIPEVWQAWEASIDLVEKLLKDFTPGVAKQSLQTMADMAVAHYQERQSK